MLSKKFKDNGYSSDFINFINYIVSNKSVNSKLIDILNSLINNEDTYINDLEQVSKMSDFNKSNITTSPIDILIHSIRFGDELMNSNSGKENIVLSGYRKLAKELSNQDDGGSGLSNQNMVNFNPNNLPKVDGTNTLKKIKFNVNGTEEYINDSLFRSMFNTSDYVNNYVLAIDNGDATLPDNLTSEIGTLYTFFKNIKKRSDAIRDAVEGINSNINKTSGVNNGVVKPILYVLNANLKDRKTVLNVSGEIYQINRGNYILVENIDSINFLYYKRNTFDMFIDEDRKIKFEFLPYQNPVKFEINNDYKINCRIGDKEFKDCIIRVTSLGMIEKGSNKSIYPILDAMTEFEAIFSEYKKIRDVAVYNSNTP